MALKLHKPAPPPVPAPAHVRTLPVHLIPPENKEPLPDLRSGEITFERVEEFVRSRKRASAFEIQKAFGIRYLDAVRLMDALEGREVIYPLADYYPFNYHGPRAVQP